MATRMRWLGQFVAGPDLWSMLVTGEIVATESSEPRTVCGLSKSVGAAESGAVETVALPRLRTDCFRACWRGRDSDADCSRTRINRDCGLSCACPRSRICRACGRG